MADISKELQAIEKAIYGEEVRGSIHDAIDKINKLNDESATNSATARQTAERAENTANNAEAIAEISFGTEITSPVSPITGYVKGETYFNNQTNDLWQCNGVGWTPIGNLKGAKGDKGDESPKPTGIVLISQVGLVKTYNLLFSDGTTFPFQVSDGQSGTGTGDMLKVVYDRNDDGVVDAAEKLVDGNKVADTKVLVELKENSDGKLEYKGQAIAGELPEDAISDENFETKMNELINAIQAGTGVNVAEEVKAKLGDTSKLPGDGTVANAIEVVSTPTIFVDTSNKIEEIYNSTTWEKLNFTYVVKEDCALVTTLGIRVVDAGYGESANIYINDEPIIYAKLSIPSSQFAYIPVPPLFVKKGQTIKVQSQFSGAFCSMKAFGIIR